MTYEVEVIAVDHLHRTVAVAPSGRGVPATDEQIARVESLWAEQRSAHAVLSEDGRSVIAIVDRT